MNTVFNFEEVRGGPPTNISKASGTFGSLVSVEESV